MYNTSVGTHILEMQKPAFPVRRINQTTLVRAVYIAIPLRHNYLAFIRAVDILRPHGKLPPRCHPSRRGEHIIIAVAFIEFGAFNRVVHTVVAIENHYRVSRHSSAVGIHFTDCNHAVESGSRSRPSVGKIHLPVLIPQRCGVYYPFPLLDHDRFAPFPLGIVGLDHENPEIRIPPVNIINTFPLPDTWRPYPLAMPGGGIIKNGRRHCVDCIINQLPINQVGRFQDWQTGSALETRSGHVICFSVRRHRNIRI